jgi:hypothetical protein
VNCTPTTPTLSDVVDETVTKDTVAMLAGAVIEIAVAWRRRC